MGHVRTKELQGKILIQMAKLHQQIERLAKNPECPDKTFLFAKENARSTQNLNQENPFAGLFIDYGIGSAFGQFIPEAFQDIDIGKAVDTYDLIQEEKQKSLKLMQATTQLSSDKELEEAYLADLPRRIVLERHYESLSMQLDEAEKRHTPTLDKKQENTLSHSLI